jgi:hypothetical protein
MLVVELEGNTTLERYKGTWKDTTKQILKNYDWLGI